MNSDIRGWSLDIIEAAEAASVEIMEHDNLDECTYFPIMKAIKAERDRCAAICDQWLAMYGQRGDELQHTTPQEWANSAATDIRSSILLEETE